MKVSQEVSKRVIGKARLLMFIMCIINGRGGGGGRQRELVTPKSIGESPSASNKVGEGARGTGDLIPSQYEQDEERGREIYCRAQPWNFPVS